MGNLNIPFNITLLELNDKALEGLRPVRSLDIFEGATKNFHTDGLFSTEIFGRVGEERRNGRFSYIDIKVSVFHPIIHHTLGQLRQLYHEIISGKTYAIWDNEIKDFVKATQIDGRTGFQFFVEHWQDIVFEERDSDVRNTNISLINKFKKQALTSKIVVMPAGLRDYEIQSDGREAEDEFNNLYRTILAISNSVMPGVIKSNIEQLNGVRYNLQIAFNKLYERFESMIEGKRKLMMGKWATRATWNGTRNVITSTNIKANELESPGNVDFNHTVVGLYQYLKATLPVSKYQIRNGFLSNVFTGPSVPAFLTDKKTLKKVSVNLKPKYFDQWMTEEGMDKVISLYGEESLRHNVLEIEGYYVGLVYKGPGVFKLFQDIDDLPPECDKSLVFPITFTELMYLSVYEKSNKYPAFVTRYPVTGYGSIYPSYMYLKPTVAVEVRKPLGDDWQVDDSKPAAYNFPITGASFVNSMSPNPARLGRLNADFDGDMCSLNAVYSEEAVAEVERLINSRNYYVDTDGKISFSVITDTVRHLIKNMTGDPAQ